MAQDILQQILRKTRNPDLIKRAFKFADSAHKGQKRASGEEYIIHPLAVAKTLAEMKMDPETVAAGLLHDVADDTEKTLEDIKKEFGKEIAFLVEGTSKLGKIRYPKEEIKTPPLEQRKEEQIDLKAENLRKMFFAMAEDIRVILIKLADRLNNMETLHFLPEEKQKRIALETMEFFAPLANRLGIGEIKGRLEDLAFSFLYPKEYNWLKKSVGKKYGKRTEYLEKTKPILLKALKKERIIPLDIHVRAKHYWSLYQKLLRYDMELDKIYDLVALRVIAKDVASCYKILGIIHKQWKPLPGRIKDYIALPRPTGYRSLHTTVFFVDGIITEIQIRTPEMHEEAEYGICAHWAKKEGVNLKTDVKKFQWVSQLRDWQKETTKPKDFWEGLKIDFFKNRIFVFTPKGDAVDLPEQATPIDFAYGVHTEIGNHCTGAKVNGKMCSLSYPLKNGDVVEIITDPSRTPARDWLDFVKTSLAKSHIKFWLKKESLPENLDKAIDMIDQELKQFQKISWHQIPKNKKEDLLKAFSSYKDLNTLLVAVGEGEITVREIVRNLVREKELFKPKKSFFERILKKDQKEKKVFLAGQAGIQIRMAKCCSPKPGDKIKAYVTSQGGAAVHDENCKNFLRLSKKWPQRVIETGWGEEKNLYPVKIKITAENRTELLSDITSVISSMGINILTISSKSKEKSNPFVITAKIETSGFEEMDNLFGMLKEVKGVASVRKI
jgi:GTP pyrophosphokinase